MKRTSSMVFDNSDSESEGESPRVLESCPSSQKTSLPDSSPADHRRKLTSWEEIMCEFFADAKKELGQQLLPVRMQHACAGTNSVGAVAKACFSNVKTTLQISFDSVN
eukprot:6474655-Amphidinium_carterae.2